MASSAVLFATNAKGFVFRTGLASPSRNEGKDPGGGVGRGRTKHSPCGFAVNMLTKGVISEGVRRCAMCSLRPVAPGGAPDGGCCWGCCPSMLYVDFWFLLVTEWCAELSVQTKLCKLVARRLVSGERDAGAMNAAVFFLFSFCYEE